jgi:uncharacterized protein (TIGR02453 family)
MAKPVITPAARKLLADLVKKQDRAWFAGKKDAFRELLVEPLLAVLTEIGPRVMDAFPAVEDAEPKIFRIYRDVRFSKDKSPFKDHVAGQLPLGPTNLYLHVDTKHVFAAVGPWMMEPADLKGFRAAIAHTDLGAALWKETQRLEKAGYEIHSHDTLTRAPAGFDPAHPYVELLKRKGYAIVLPQPPAKSLVDGTLPKVVAASLVKTKTALEMVRKAMSFRP